MALETHDLLRFLLSFDCKWPVINVTLLTLKIATQNTRQMGYFPIVIMNFFELYMFRLDLNTNLRHLWSVFLLVRVTYVTFFYEIAYYDFLDYILEKTMIPNLKYVIKISIQTMNVHSYILQLLISCNSP